MVLDFWATGYCPPCREEIPHFIQLYHQTSRDNLVIAGMSDEEAKTLTDFVKQQNVSYPIASAKNLPSPYSDIQAIPTTFFIDRKGTIQTILVGYHQYDDLKQDATGADFPRHAKSGARRGGPAGGYAKPNPESNRLVVNQYSRRAGAVRGGLGERRRPTLCWCPRGQHFTSLS